MICYKYVTVVIVRKYCIKLSTLSTAVVISVGPASSEPLKMISGIQYPTHIATGQNGEIVVASYMSHQVHVYNRVYQPLCTFGSNGLIDGQFICPSGIAVD